MSKTTKVAVPKEAGSQLTVRYSAGEEPKTYRVQDGHVTVDNEHVDRFLSAVGGSKADAGTSGGATQGE